MSKKLFSVILLLSLGFAAFAQNALKGVVKDENGAPLEGVTVMIAGTTNGTITDAEGKYSISSRKSFLMAASASSPKKAARLRMWC